MERDIWTPVSIYCPNCGKLNYGYRDKENKIRYECKRCQVKLVRINKSRRHDTLELYAPAGQVSLL